MIDTWVQIDIKDKLQRDLIYIKNDIICKEAFIDKSAAEDEKERFIKFCRPLNAIGVIDMTKKQYKKYWNTQYLNFPKERQTIFEAIEEKFKTGLTPLEEMLEIINNSKDLQAEKDKATKLLKEAKDERRDEKSNKQR